MSSVAVTITLNEDGTAAIAASPQLAGNRVAMYGLLQMGLELIHRMGDAKPLIEVPKLGLTT
jgi:hypothetical protein